MGCGCHAVQLAAKHLLPLRQTKAAPRSSSSSSSSSTSSAPSAEEAPARAPRPGSPERSRLNDALWPILQRSRKLVRHYAKSADHLRELEADALEASAPLVSFAVETVTRWSSTLELLTKELQNDRALAVSAAKRGERPGVERLDARGKKLQLHLCCVLQPLRAATKMLEGDGPKARASLYLPIWAGLQAALRDEGNLKAPRELRDLVPEGVPARQLATLAKDCRKWLAKDLQRIRERHLQGTEGLKLLQAATYLDPRFKAGPPEPGSSGPSWASPAELKTARSVVKAMAIRAAEQFPFLVDAHKNAAAHPDRQPLVATPAGKRAPKRRRVVEDDEPAGAGAVVAAAAQAQPLAKRLLAERPSAEDLLFPSGSASSAGPEPAIAALDAEVEAQLKRFAALPPRATVAIDATAWWREHAWQFPHLASVAMHLAGMPASTAALERLFSAAGRAVTKSRPRLHDASAAKLIYGHANVRRGHTGASKRLPPL